MATAFTDAGEGLVADLFDGTASAPANYYVGWGTGGTAGGAGDAVVGDTALNTAASEARVAATESQPAANTNRFVGQITADGAKTITEVGLFTAAAAGTMPVRSVFAGIALALNDRIEFTIDVVWAGQVS